LELFPGCSLGEWPVDGSALFIAFVGPSQRFSGYCVPIGDPSIQALFHQRRELKFRHIQPTGFFRRLV